MRVNSAILEPLPFQTWILAIWADARAAFKRVERMAQQATTAVSNRLWRKRSAYRQIFLNQLGALNESAKIVVADIARFCNATTTTMVRSPVTQQVDMFATGVAEGRRQAYLLIMKHLGVSDADILRAMSQEQAYHE